MASSKKPKTDLTSKQIRFCQEYIVDMNATQAAIRAGYSEKSAMEQGYQLLQKTPVRQKVDELKVAQQKRIEISADTILRELLRLATVDVTQAFDERGWLKDLKDIPEDVRRAISGLEIQELFQGEGEDRHIIGVVRKLRFYDKIKPLELLGKHIKLFADRIEHSGPDGKPIETINKNQISDEELDAKIKALMAKKEG